MGAGAAANDGNVEQALLVEGIRAEVESMLKRGGGRQRGAKVPRTGGSGGGGAVEDADCPPPAHAATVSDVLSTFVLRRTKAGTNLGLPPKTRKSVWAAPTPSQARVIAMLHGVTLALAPASSLLVGAVRSAIAAAAGSPGAGAAGAGPPDDGASAPAAAEVAHVAEAAAAAPTAAAPEHTAPTDGGAAAEGGAAAGGAAASETAPLGLPIFIGDLTNVLGADFGATGAAALRAAETDVGAAAAAARSAGSQGKLVVLLRKAAVHPLLLRTRFTNAACLALTRAAWGGGVAAAGGGAGGAAGGSGGGAPAAALDISVLHDLEGCGAPLAAHACVVLPLGPVSAAHATLTMQQLLQWAGGDKALARSAQAMLRSSDMELHALAQDAAAHAPTDAERAVFECFLLPPDALMDATKMRWLARLVADCKVRSRGEGKLRRLCVTPPPLPSPTAQGEPHRHLQSVQRRAGHSHRSVRRGTKWRGDTGQHALAAP